MRSSLIHLCAALSLAAAPLHAEEAAPPPPPPVEPPPPVPEPPPEPPPPDPAPPAPEAAPPEAAPPAAEAPPAAAPAAAAPAATPEPEVAAAPPADPEEPTLEEKRLVAYVATGVALASLATGITLGVLAQGQFDCASDVVACNETRANKIVGRELFDARNQIEQTAIAADISYLFAATSALVATMGWLQGFVFTDAAEGAE